MDRRLLLVIVMALMPAAAGAQVPMIPAPYAPTVPFSGDTNGITVTGRGSVVLTPRDVHVSAFAHGLGDRQAAIAAMQAAGLEQAMVGTPPGSPIGGNEQVVLRGTIRNATVAKLDALGATAAEYVRTHPGSQVFNIQITAAIGDCAAVRRELREAALADARSAAAEVAALAGVRPGAPVAITELNPVACDAELQLDPSTLQTRVTTFERVTYGLESGRAR